jgi:hypothetical protein
MEEIQTIAVLGKALAISSSRTYLYRHAEETSIDSDQLACSCMYSVLDKHAQGDGRPRIRPWKLGDSWRTESSLPHPQARPPRPASGDEQTKEETAVAHGSGVGTTADGDLRGFWRLRIAARRRLLARRAAGTSGVASCRAAAPFGERYRGPPCPAQGAADGEQDQREVQAVGTRVQGKVRPAVAHHHGGVPARSNGYSYRKFGNRTEREKSYYLFDDFCKSASMCVTISLKSMEHLVQPRFSDLEIYPLHL